jgi:hypothetical protein
MSALSMRYWYSNEFRDFVDTAIREATVTHDSLYRLNV